MIKSIDKASVQKITSGQVVVDLQTAVKELVENSLDAGATTVEVRLKDYGVESFEVIDNGTGVAARDYDTVALKHHTSKLENFDDLTSVETFGFRGEALSSLCALAKSVKITTATSSDAPMGTILELDKTGGLISSSAKVARQRGTTVLIEGLFTPLPVRRKELERNAKREFGKALNLLTAYALVPCSKENKGVKLTVSHQPHGGRKITQLQTHGSPTLRASISNIWGPKQLDSLQELDLRLEVFPEKNVIRRQGVVEVRKSTLVTVRGFMSRFSPGHGRTANDRQFFFINGRPCNPAKVQKAFNEVYRTFNANQSPFIVADFILSTDSYDINVSPDKRTILLHSEDSLILALKASLENTFAPTRSTYAVQASQTQRSAQDPGLPEDTTDVSQVGDDLTEVNQDNENTGDSGAHNGSNTAPATSNGTDLNKQASTSTTLGSHSSAGSSAASRLRPLSFLESETQSTDSQSDFMDLDENPQPSAMLEPQSTMPSRQSLTPEVMTFQSGYSGVNIAEVQSASNPPETDKIGPIPNIGSLSDRRQEQSIIGKDSGHIAKKHCSDSSRQNNKDGENRDKIKTHSVQMILNATGTSWELQQPSSEEIQCIEPPKKKSRIEGPAGRSEVSKQRLRTHLSGFAREKTRATHETEAVESSDGADHQKQSDEDENSVGDFKVANDHPPTRPNVTDFTYSKGGSTSSESHAAYQNTQRVDTAARAESLSPDEDHTPDVVTTVTTQLQDASENNDTATVNASSSGGSEVLRTIGDDDEELILRFDLSRLQSTWAQVVDIGSHSPATRTMSLSTDANIHNVGDDESAERELSRVIHKEDFDIMEVVGQFNLGFIIARRRVAGETAGRSSQGILSQDAVAEAKPAMDDLFIIDQHAADEKYNFETLQQNTKIQSQKLYSPLTLELTAADQLVAIENIDILRKNGFDVCIDMGSETDASHKKLKLIAQPVSGSTSFNVKDLEELIHLMRDHPAGRMVRCSKARAMFASRACRKSVMIGHALTAGKMTSVIRHMGELQQPWNCPHGRPTMRHLVCLLSNEGSSASAERPIEWQHL